MGQVTAPEVDQTSKDDAYLTLDQVAGRWQVHKKTVAARIRRGELAAFRIGRDLRVSLASVLDFEERNKTCTDPASQPEPAQIGA